MTTKKGMSSQLCTDFLIEHIIERKIPDGQRDMESQRSGHKGMSQDWWAQEMFLLWLEGKEHCFH